MGKILSGCCTQVAPLPSDLQRIRSYNLMYLTCDIIKSFCIKPRIAFEDDGSA